MTTKNQSSTLEKPETVSNIMDSKKDQQSLRDVFEKELNGMYDGEKQLVKALQEMANAAFNEDLEEAFRDHLEQTKKQVERLDKIFARLRINKTNEKCLGMEGLIEAGKKMINELGNSPARDSALIINAQKVEHYEIAAYGSLAELADVLGFHQAVDLFERSLQEEEETDDILTDIAEEINDEAAEQDKSNDYE
jgi:ferritin-like metal-binding protein YciE